MDAGSRTLNVAWNGTDTSVFAKRSLSFRNCLLQLIEEKVKGNFHIKLSAIFKESDKLESPPDVFLIYIFVWPVSGLFDRHSEERTGKQGQTETGEDMQQRAVGWIQTRTGHHPYSVWLPAQHPEAHDL